MAPGGVEGADDNEVGVLLTEEYVMEIMNNSTRRKFLSDLRKHATGATITSYRSEKSWFASALVRLHDASLDWMLVHGTLKKDTLDAALLTIPVFVALFAEIGKSHEMKNTSRPASASCVPSRTKSSSITGNKPGAVARSTSVSTRRRT
jgi:hypothetical protein